MTDLLSLAEDGQRPRTGVPVSLRAAAGRAADRWAEPAALAGTTIEREGTADAWALASAGDVDTILDALIENALHYGGEGGVGGTVSIAVEHGPVLAVLDRGPGLAPGEADQVFGRFYRGSASRQGAPGTGLGLTIVETLARRWGASASLGDRPGGGARAEVRFAPAEPGPAPAGGEPEVEQVAR